MERTKPNPAGRPSQREAEAFSDSVCALRPRLMRVALRVVKNPADAEDVLQDALRKAYQGLSGFRHEGALSTWLIRITVNQAILHLRKTRREVTLFDDPDPHTGRGLADSLPAPGRSPEQSCFDNELTSILRDSISRVRLAYRTLLVWSAWCDMSNQQIADRLCLPVNIVKVRLHRARKQLRLILADRLAGDSKGGRTNEVSELKGVNREGTRTTPTDTAHAGESKCRLEPLQAKMSRTTVYTRREAGVDHVTRIEIAGEDVAHLFQGPRMSAGARPDRAPLKGGQP